MGRPKGAPTSRVTAKINKDILRESARIILQTSLIGAIILNLIITSITNEEKIISQILYKFSLAWTNELTWKWLTGQSYFEVWDSLIDNINKKYIK